MIIIINNMTSRYVTQEELKTDLHSKGGRITKQRKVILDYLNSVTCHPTAKSVYKALSDQHPALGIATVYRNLRYLADNGYILEIKSKDDESHFDGNTDFHLHIICTQCHNIKDYFDKTIVNIKRINRLTNVTNIDCNVYGVCHMCKK
jgi:Fur family transcriptional regulator, peroxide stress response regulator